MIHRTAGERPVRTGRIETLVDGVFAIALTILVLDLKAPPAHGPLPREAFTAFISQLGDPLFNFAVSFLLLSLFWIWHHRQFNEIRRTDPVSLGINLCFLAAVSMIPFTTSMMSRFRDMWEADIFFHLNIFTVGLLMELNWWYSTRGFRLVDRGISPERVRLEIMRGLAAPMMALAGVAASFIVRGDSAAVYLLLPLLGRGMAGIPSGKREPE